MVHVTSSDNTWNDPVAVSAHYHASRVFDYYFDTHNRLGLDGRGRTIFSVVHVTNDDQPMDNAYWNGGIIAYGDGNSLFKPLAGALDVAAHEMTHAIIGYTVDLDYRFQSGALNESLCDVFGALVDRDDWQIGEDVAKPSVFPSGAMRDMVDPHNGFEPDSPFWQPAHMDEFVDLPLDQDNGGVHLNSGIPNRAAFLIAEGLGREKTERIYYRILDARYLNRRANFVDMRLAATRAATDLFGDSSSEVLAVLAAFDQVGIQGLVGVRPAADRAPFVGEEWIAVINAEPGDRSLLLVRPEITSDSDIIQLTDTQVSTRTGSPISTTTDGSLLLFVDADNFIRTIRPDGSEETVLTDTGEWSSIALSPDSTRLAATTVFRDSTIFLFDLIDPEASKQVRLYSPTTQEGVRSYITRFADAMDWDADSRILLFDNFNSIPREGSRSIEFWNINFLDPDSEVILPLLTNQFPEGIGIGNPSFAQTNDNIIVYDVFDNVAGTNEIWAADLFTGTANRIEANGPFFGYPRYSPNDDYLVFEQIDWENRTPTLRTIRLEADKIRAAAPSEPLTQEVIRPTWFGVGQRPSAVVDESGEPQPDEIYLAQNYPNPFNSATVIRFALPQSQAVDLTVYNLAGQQVVTLVEGRRPAGPYTVPWDGRADGGRPLASGVYLYRLRAGDWVKTRKLLLVR